MLYVLLGELANSDSHPPCFKMETIRSLFFDDGYMVNLPCITWLTDHLFLFPCFKMEAARSAVFEKTSFPPFVPAFCSIVHIY